MKCFYHYLHLDASGLISVTSMERLNLGVGETTLSTLSAIFDSTTIVDLTLHMYDLNVFGLETVSKI